MSNKIALVSCVLLLCISNITLIAQSGIVENAFTLPNGNIKNPKLPANYGIDNNTIYYINPIPAEKKAEAVETEPLLILVSTPETKLDTAEIQTDTPETKADTPETKPDTPATQADTPETNANIPEINTENEEITTMVSESPNESDTQNQTVIINSTDQEIPLETNDVVQNQSQYTQSFYDEPEIEVFSENDLNSDIQPITISRTIDINCNQFLDIVFYGKGWIYLGETEQTNILTYKKRNFENSNTVFVFFADKSGSTILHFYKQDVITGSWIDEYCEVSVSTENANDSKTHSILPIDGKVAINSIDDTESKIETNNILNDTDNKEIEVVNNEGLTVHELIVNAQNALNQQQYQEAVEYISQWENLQTEEERENALFLMGQIYESKFDGQNIKKAYDAYNSLLIEFPQSKSWKKAYERKKYIDNFYFSIN